MLGVVSSVEPPVNVGRRRVTTGLLMEVRAIVTTVLLLRLLLLRLLLWCEWMEGGLVKRSYGSRMTGTRGQVWARSVTWWVDGAICGWQRFPHS